MTSYKQLLEQRESLELQIREAKKRETGTAIAQVRALISEFGLTAQDVFPSTKARVARAGAKVAAKYRNTATGQTWTGRGKAPKWIDGKERTQFLIR
ncbi:MAG: H-NS histone family protein [Rhodoferax sp.]|nr:H-NS histone family protein [Rhodoferax sp.]